MPDGFQAEPPRWSSERPSAYERFSEVNLRKPDRPPSGSGPWVIVAVVAAVIGVGLSAFVAFGLALHRGRSATFVTVSAPVTAPAMAPVPVAVPAVVPVPAVAPVPAADANALQSTWTATAVVVNGEEAPDEDLAKIKLTMDELEFNLVLPSGPQKGAWELDSRNNPKELDFIVDGVRRLRAIYELEEDRLKICMTLSPDDGRPGNFTSSKGSRRVLVHLKRINPVVVIETSMGNITIELFEDKAPITVKNFLGYVDDKFYDGTIFHRVIGRPGSPMDFMIQGGGYEPGMKEKKTRDPIKNESDNNLSNQRGTIAMARAPRPDSATCQFFINVANNTFLDKAKFRDQVGYCVFGKVIEGMDVVDQIKAVEVGQSSGHENVPRKDVVIKSIIRAPWVDRH
jgi:peptidyl-prolyl cis-trans isomerase B (cyclophilin B)